MLMQTGCSQYGVMLYCGCHHMTMTTGKGQVNRLGSAGSHYQFVTACAERYRKTRFGCLIFSPNSDGRCIGAGRIKKLLTEVGLHSSHDTLIDRSRCGMVQVKYRPAHYSVNYISYASDRPVWGSRLYTPRITRS